MFEIPVSNEQKNNLICSSSITKIFQSIFTQSYKYIDFHIIREEIFTLVELHGIQNKCNVNDSKTKRYGNSKFLSLTIKKQAYKFRPSILTQAEFQCVYAK